MFGVVGVWSKCRIYLIAFIVIVIEFGTISALRSSAEYLNLGKEFNQKKCHMAAAYCLKKVINLDVNAPFEVFELLIGLYERLKMTKEAIHMSELSIERYPNLEQAHRVYGSLLQYMQVIDIAPAWHCFQTMTNSPFVRDSQQWQSIQTWIYFIWTYKPLYTPLPNFVFDLTDNQLSCFLNQTLPLVNSFNFLHRARVYAALNANRRVYDLLADAETRFDSLESTLMSIYQHRILLLSMNVEKFDETIELFLKYIDRYPNHEGFYQNIASA
jgi:tetratricopeptide (TPR) repeat protein